MTAKEIHERAITANGIQLHVATAGEPVEPAVLLLHGLYDRWEVWEPVIQSFSEDSWVIAPDLRGHARSEKPMTGYIPQDYAEDMAALLDNLKVSEVVAVGHSLGALIAAQLAAGRQDRVRGVVLVDPPFEQSGAARQWLEILLEAKRGTAEETYETVKELNILSGNDEEWRRQTDWLRSTADGPFESMIEMIDQGQSAHDIELLRDINCPALLLQADPDSGGALSDAGATQAMDQLNNARLHKIEGTGHSIHRERPELLVRAVNEFLASLGHETA